MKTQLLWKCSLGLAFSLLPFVTGCYSQASDASPELVSPTNVDLAAAPTVVATPAPDLPAVPEPAPSADKSLPPNIRPSTPLAEVVKLAQSGVDESVMLAFVKNSAGTFNLGSDEIIYLNDLGVPDGVVTAMIQRDQALKESWSNAAQASAASAANSQVAPAYENPPAAAPPPTEPSPDQPPPANVTYNYFYDTLSPYGTWVDLDNYGWCWQPTVVVINHDWRPYCDRGHWIYSDCGWYWLSDYSWGWAPFHYGRWFRHGRFGWCWTPDTVWAPAWVSWRYSNDYCGWAPLPPAANFRPGFGFTYYGGAVGVGFDFGLSIDCYSFVGWNHFWDHRPNRYALPRHQVTQIFNNTTVINNIVQGNNNIVINCGISRDRVGALTRTEIRQITLHAAVGATSRGGRGEWLDRDGRTLIVQRPHFTAATASTDDRRGNGGRQNFPGGAAPTTRPVEPPQSIPSSGGASPRRPDHADRTPDTSHSSSIVIGRRGTAQFSEQNFHPAPAPLNSVPQIERRGSSAGVETPAIVARNNSWQQQAWQNPPQPVMPQPPVQTSIPQFNRQESPRISRGIENRFDPPPIASQMERPQYSPAASRSAPAPSYTPPPPSRAPSAPAPAPSRSDSGRQDSGRDSRGK